VLEDVAVVRERSYNGGIPKIYSELDAGVVRGNTVPIRKGDAIAKIVFFYRLAIALKHEKMRLVDVESVNLL
jgi:hypothetical protein